MNGDGLVMPDGCVYIRDGVIVEIKKGSAARPAGFSASDLVATKGTIFPGLIELHNHLPYDILSLWQVPRKFGNRGQWGVLPEYDLRVSSPMKIIGESSALLPAVVRYVEAKCLLAGVTTAQGIALFSNAGSRRYYRGVVRNVEQTDEAVLPEALTRVADVEAKSISSFHERLKRSSCLLLHLAEGKDKTARKHFLALKKPDGSWAIERSLAGIHCAALEAEDFKLLADKGASMVWSPLSNLLLYGDTADMKAALSTTLNICLGSDWSPTGSKNLLGELKVAKIWAGTSNLPLSGAQILAMVTSNAARALRWDSQLGSLEPGKKADVVVVQGTTGDAHDALIDATEADIRLVVINGIARHGEAALMSALGITGEALTIKGKKFLLNFAQETEDPDVAKLTLSGATQVLKDALGDLAKVAGNNKKLSLREVETRSLAGAPRRWFLALDELSDTGEELRPRLEFQGQETGPSLAIRKAPKPTELPSLKLDPLTAIEDAAFFETLKGEVALPDDVASKLAKFYT